MDMSNRMRWILVAGLAVVVACGSDKTTSTEGGTKTADLNFPVLGNGAPPLCSDSAGAWFYKNTSGPDQEIALVFSEHGNPGGCGEGETEDFLRLRLKGSSLYRKPDSTLISEGDSVFISVKWVGNDSILFVLQPSGLLFDPANPAQLKIEYGECDQDFDHNGNDDDEGDHEIEQKLDIWRQERPTDDWFRVGTAKIEQNKEIDARLNGFSRFAIAY